MAKKQVIETYGPYGNNLAAQNFSMKLEGSEIIKEVRIRHGFVVDLIGFIVGDQHANKSYAFGGNGGNYESQIKLKSGEYITRISGRTGENLHVNNHRMISTLVIHTNLCPYGYGPFGTQEFTTNVYEFSSPMPTATNGRVIGFFGQTSKTIFYLLSLGVYVEKNEVIEKYGPYGNNLAAQNFSMKLEGSERIKEVIIRHAFVVDSIGFIVGDQRSNKRFEFGGDGGYESKIVLKFDEYITSMNGTTGENVLGNYNRMISTLKIHTNLCPTGYGPFGTGQFSQNVYEFSFVTPSDSRIIGFFGEISYSIFYLLSLGFYVQKHYERSIDSNETEKSNEEQLQKQPKEVVQPKQLQQPLPKHVNENSSPPAGVKKWKSKNASQVAGKWLSRFQIGQMYFNVSDAAAAAGAGAGCAHYNSGHNTNGSGTQTNGDVNVHSEIGKQGGVFVNFNDKH